MPSLITGSTYRFQLTAQKDGAAWNLTGATVKFLLRAPAGGVLTAAATVTDGPGGVAEYVNGTAELPTGGGWRRAWEIDDGAIVQRSPWIFFDVFAVP